MNTHNPVLKLKQASAVLGISPKELQNLVQFGVVKPRKRQGLTWFDRDVLLQAKVGWYLRESLGISTRYLAQLVKLACEAANTRAAVRKFVRLKSRPASAAAAIEIRIPVQSLAAEIEERMPLAELYRDLPRGRKRPGWRAEFLESLSEAAGDLAELTEQDILLAVKHHRITARSMPEITVAWEAKSTSA